MDKLERKERNDRMWVLYNQGLSYRNIGKIEKVSKSGVHKIINELLRLGTDVCQEHIFASTDLRDCYFYFIASGDKNPLEKAIDETYKKIESASLHLQNCSIISKQNGFPETANIFTNIKNILNK